MSYLAGIIDGEGYIGINKRMPSLANRMTVPRYDPRIAVTMCECEAVKLLCNTFGASLGQRPGRSNNARGSWSFDITNHRAAKVATIITPFLLIKKKQAQLIIELDLLRQQSRSYRDRVVSIQQFKGGPKKGSNYKVLGVNKNYVQKCEQYYQECLQLNKKGNGDDYMRG